MDIIKLIKQTAEKHGLDPGLVFGVVAQESSRNTYAVRYEPAFFTRYIVPLNLDISESICRAISWGLMQVMGQVAREWGFKGYLSELCDPEVGLEYGCRHLARKIKRYGVEGGISAYNAGIPTDRNRYYVDQVLKFSKDPSTKNLLDKA